MAIQTRPSGIPDENARSDTAAVRGDLNACATARNPFGRGAGDAAAGGATVDEGSGIALLIKDTGARNASIRGDYDHDMYPQV
jgi:hypothetical protein